MREAIMHDSFGECTIKGFKWIRNATPKCLLVIAHGMAEKIERYTPFAEFLLAQHIFVYGHDHRGHGQTAGSIGSLGILGDNGWMKMKEDLRRLVVMAKNDYPNTPLVILGHSMGSFLVRDFLLDYALLADGYILSGTGFMNMPLLNLAHFIASVECKIKGTRHISRLMDQLSFGRYNQRIENPISKMDWLSRDEGCVAAYNADPFCGHIHSSGFYVDFLDNLKRILYKAEYVNFKPSIPMLIFSGAEDPVGDYGVGPQKTYRHYKEIGFDATLKLYPGGRHEMLNEINREEVYAEIIQWLTPLLAPL